MLLQASQNFQLMGAQNLGNFSTESDVGQGMFGGHAYTIISAKELVPGSTVKACRSTLPTGGWRVEHDSRCIRKEGRKTEFVTVPISSLKSTLRIVLLRNPWGDQNKWTGTWS